MNGYLDIDLAKIRQSEFKAEAQNRVLLKSLKEAGKPAPTIRLYSGSSRITRFANWLLLGFGVHRG